MSSIKAKIRQTSDLKGQFTLNNQIVSQTVKLSASGLTLGDLENVNLNGQVDGALVQYDSTNNEYVVAIPPPLNIVADTNDANNPGVVIGTDSLTLSGTANQINTTKAADTVTFAFPNNVTIPNNLTVTNDLLVSNDLTVTGDLNISSGLGIAAGGTGLTAVTDKSVMVVASGAISFLTNTSEGAVVQFDSNGDPTTSTLIDGGTYD
jgi:phage baseplate assembly protein gpV